MESCSILTTAEVEQVIGKLKGAPKADKEEAAAWCSYEFADGKNAFEVWVFPADGIDRARKQAKTRTTVKGFGDDAFITRGMHGLDYVDLFIKKEAVTVKLSLKEAAGDEDKLKTLAYSASLGSTNTEAMARTMSEMSETATIHMGLLLYVRARRVRLLSMSMAGSRRFKGRVVAIESRPHQTDWTSERRFYD